MDQEQVYGKYSSSFLPGRARAGCLRKAHAGAAAKSAGAGKGRLHRRKPEGDPDCAGRRAIPRLVSHGAAPHRRRCCAPSRPLSGHSGLYGRSGYPRRSHRLYAHAGCSVRDASPRTKGACGRSERCAAHCGFRECSGRDEHRCHLPLGSGAGHGRSAAYLHVLRSVDPARGAREHGHRVPDSMGCAG